MMNHAGGKASLMRVTIEMEATWYVLDSLHSGTPSALLRKYRKTKKMATVKQVAIHAFPRSGDSMVSNLSTSAGRRNRKMRERCFR